MRIAIRNAAILVLALIAGTLTATSFAADPPAPSFVGHWEGKVEANGATLPLVFDIVSDKGVLKGTLNSPAQSNFRAELDTVRQDGKHVIAELRMIDGKYEGDLSTDGGEIAGSWSQRGYSVALTMHRGK
jgi:uncharacterized protein